MSQGDILVWRNLIPAGDELPGYIAEFGADAPRTQACCSANRGGAGKWSGSEGPVRGRSAGQ